MPWGFYFFCGYFIPVGVVYFIENIVRYLGTSHSAEQMANGEWISEHS